MAAYMIFKAIVALALIACVLLPLKKSLASIRSFWTISTAVFGVLCIIDMNDGKIWWLLFDLILTGNAVWNVYKMKGDIVPSFLKKYWVAIVLGGAFATGFILAICIDFPLPGEGIPFYFMRYLLVPAMAGAACGLVASNVVWCIKGKPQNMPIKVLP